LNATLRLDAFGQILTSCQKGFPDYCNENIDFLYVCSEPDLRFDPPPGLGLLAPGKDCIAVSA
jgi:hypothetical protein